MYYGIVKTVDGRKITTHLSETIMIIPTNKEHEKYKEKCILTTAWLAQLVERRNAKREGEGLSPRPDQHSGS